MNDSITVKDIEECRRILSEAYRETIPWQEWVNGEMDRVFGPRAVYGPATGRLAGEREEKRKR